MEIFCQEISYRDLAGGCFLEGWYKDLAKRPLVKNLYRDLVKRTDILPRDLIDSLNRDLTLKNFAESFYGISYRHSFNTEPVIEISHAIFDPDIFTKGTCRIEPGITDYHSISSSCSAQH